jgi:hypothetical protein
MIGITEQFGDAINKSAGMQDVTFSLSPALLQQWQRLSMSQVQSRAFRECLIELR